jgi:uncharacterized delta-60 repeat protein
LFGILSRRLLGEVVGVEAEARMWSSDRCARVRHDTDRKGRGGSSMRRSFRASITVALCLAIAATATPAIAAPGDLDTTFSGDGVKTVDYGLGPDYFYGVAVDGNAPIACGNTSSRATLTAFKPRGGLDTTFSGDGMLRLDILGHGSSYFEACRTLPDGRVVAVGGAKGADGHDRMIVVVRRPNGKPDTNFSGDGLAVIRFSGIADSDAYDLAIQPDGKIVVAGEGFDNSFSPTKGFFEIARLRPNGALDKTFSGDGMAKVDFGPTDEGAWKVAIQHDGAITVAGWIRNKADTEWNTAVARLKASGAPDKTFSGDGRATFNLFKGNADYALGMDIRSGGAIVLGVYGNDGAYKALVAQLTTHGKLNTSFGGGDGIDPIAVEVNLQDLMLVGGKILVAGRTNTNANPIIVRLKSSGSPDDTFGSNGVAALGSVSGWLYDITTDRQGRIVGSGQTGPSGDGLVLRVHT